MGGQTAELQQVVLLEAGGQIDVVEVIEAVDRMAESLEVLLLDKQIVIRIVDRFDVEVLHRYQVRLDERNVVIT